MDSITASPSPLLHKYISICLYDAAGANRFTEVLAAGSPRPTNGCGPVVTTG